MIVTEYPHGPVASGSAATQHGPLLWTTLCCISLSVTAFVTCQVVSIICPGPSVSAFQQIKKPPPDWSVLRMLLLELSFLFLVSILMQADRCLNVCACVQCNAPAWDKLARPPGRRVMEEPPGGTSGEGSCLLSLEHSGVPVRLRPRSRRPMRCGPSAIAYVGAYPPGTNVSYDIYACVCARGGLFVWACVGGFQTATWYGSCFFST